MQSELRRRTGPNRARLPIPGLKNNDILLELGGKKVASQPSEFLKALNEFKTGDKVDAVVLRKGKRETVKDVTLPDVPKGFGPGFPGGPNFQIPNLPALPQSQPPDPAAPQKETRKK